MKTKRATAKRSTATLKTATEADPGAPLQAGEAGPERSLETPGAVERDRRGELLPARQRVGGIITPQ
jgi:hypothetical protein